MPKITASEMIKKRVTDVRERMQAESVDIYIIGDGDYHMSEYSGDYFAERRYMSGFTGSAGTLVITADTAALFTDGRYFVQAQLQLENTGIELMKQGCAGVPSLIDYCKEILPEEGCIGFDGRTVGALQGLELKAVADEKNGKIKYGINIIESIWKDRPEFPHTKAFELDLSYAGESRLDKIVRVRKKMEEMHAQIHVIASLDDICWLFNIRGNDVECNPVIMAYAMITDESVTLFADRDRFDQKLINKLHNENIEIRPYGTVYDEVAALRKTTIMLDKARVNMKLFASIDESVKKIVCENPSVLMKAVKNKTELENLRDIHIQDGLAVTRFMYWLKKQLSVQTPDQKMEANSSATITEAAAAAYLDYLRSGIKGYVELSFPTISAYNANAAMMHYSASEENCAKLEPKGMLLVDSGGQYLEGTTDVTRTFALGEVTAQMKKHFTLTLKGMLALANAHFLKGCTGFNLDILARQPLWEEGIDYRCGTGHGIGYLLNVHESPNGFRWKHNPGHNDLCIIEEGMVTSDEPGVYIEGEYGIRIENEIVCVKDYENEYGTFLRFEMLTCVPIDLDLVELQYLNAADRERLNQYHTWVFSELSPYMSGEELDFLKEYTRTV